jgi:hypothetical protein
MNQRSQSMSLGAVYSVADVDVTGCFEPPAAPGPRERYRQERVELPTRPGCWNKAAVTITETETGRIAATYERNYPGDPPFEPFRQGDREYALISRHYTAASVVDLQSGKVVAAEEPSVAGFCPVGFYVPDWRDLHDGSVPPGSHYWSDHDEWPDGALGFVWGCVWGDDNGWKVQALDLSRVSDGKIGRDERFGYLYLDSNRKLDPSEFIRCYPGEGSTGPHVFFSVPQGFDIATGKAVGSWGQ